MSFSPNPITETSGTIATLTIDNSANAIAATNLDFTLVFSGAGVLGNQSTLSNTCGGSTIFQFIGDTIGLRNGTVSAGGSCTVSVQQAYPTDGNFVETTGDLTSSLGNSGPASDTIVVEPFPLPPSPTTTITTSGGISSFNQSAPRRFVAAIIFSERMRGFSNGELSATNATVGPLIQVGGRAYTATISPTGNGDVALDVAAGVAQGRFSGLENLAAAQVTVMQLDDVAPTVEITTDSGGSFNKSAPGSFTATVTFSEPVTGFANSDLTATNATVAALSPAGGAGTVFTAVITPSGTGDVALNAEAAVAQDGNANTNEAAATVTVMQLDDVAPTVEITTDSGGSFNKSAPGSFIATVTFSEPVTGFADSDLTATNATVAALSPAGGAGTIFTAIITPSGTGDVALNAVAAVAQDGNANANAAAATVTVIQLDDVAPMVTIATTSMSHDGSTGFVVTVTFDEPVTGFADGDLTATNATVGPLSPSNRAGTVFTAMVTPAGPLDVGLGVASGVAEDASGNLNPAAADVTVTGNIVEHSQEVIATFMLNRANHIVSNQPDFIGYVTGSNTNGGGPLGNLALSVDEFSQVLAFSTSRSKILTERDRAGQRGVLGTNLDPLAVATRQFEGGTIKTRGQSGELSVNDKSHALSGETQTGIAGADLIADQRQSSAALNVSDTNNVAASDREGFWDIWTEIYGSASNSGTSDSSLWVGYVGAHYFITDRTLVGIVGQVDWAEETNAALGSRAEGTGWLIGPYIAGQFPGYALFYEARASWGTSDNDVSPVGTYTDSFETTRWLASGKIGGVFDIEGYYVNPSVSVSYFEETQDSYTDSLANVIPEQTVSLGEVRFGPEISQKIELEDGTLFQPSVGISGVYNFGIKSNTASQGFALGDDELRARVDIGFSATKPNGMILSAGGFYDGIGADEFDSFGGRIKVTVPLN